MAPTYLIQTRTTKEIELERDQIVSMQEAADMLGVSVQAIGSALNRGAFTTILRPARRGKTRSHHRSLLRSEVEAAVAAKQAQD